MSVHFSRYPDDDGPEQAPCGIWIGHASDLSSDWNRVDCKRCLKWKDTIMATHEAEESAIVQQMGEMAEFMKRTAGEQMTDSVSIYKLGIYGKAYDVPGTRRAYTYQHQPDNLGASKLGGACFAAFKAGGGDYIDYGLGLLKQLELRGFGVYEVGEALDASQAQQALAPENQRVVPAEPLLPPRHPFDRPSVLKDSNVGYSAGAQMPSILRQRVKLLADVEAGITEQAVRDKLVSLGWTPPTETVRIPECGLGYGHGGRWCGPHVDCWLDPRPRAEREAPQQAQVSRIPAGLYAELEALRTLRDATGVYLQGYMRDEIEDEDNCVSVDQHDAACSVKSALDNARAREWKGGDK